MPTLLLVGAADDWTAAAPCPDMVADAKGWKGTSQHSATTKKCYAGFGSQAAATTLDGIITCDP